MMRRWADSLKFASFVLIPMQGRTKTLYNLLDQTNSLGEEREYLNLGYWATGARDLDQAGEAMAKAMAEAAKLSPDDEVLDVGCGLADQDIYWAKHYAPRKIVAVNLNARQVRHARAKVEREGLPDRISVLEADACDLPFADESFDVVFGLESAFHFRTREDFFREAHRVLRPGGRLVLMDLAAVDRRLKLRDRLFEIVGRSFWQIPKANMYPIEVYKARLRDKGFRDVHGRSVWTDVYPPFVDFARARLRAPEVRQRLNPAFRWILTSSLKARQSLDPTAMDYVFVRATK